MVLSSVGRRDYYEILGIAPGANTDSITDAFHRLARRYHPDRSKESDAEDRFKEITEAYSVLSDPGKRAEYDVAHMAEPYSSGRPGRNHFFTVGVGVDADGLSRVFLGARDGAASRTGSDIRLEVEIPLRAAASATRTGSRVHPPLSLCRLPGPGRPGGHRAAAVPGLRRHGSPVADRLAG